MQDLFDKCNDPGKLYTLSRTFPVIDLFNPPDKFYQTTVSKKHTLSLDESIEMCKVFSSLRKLDLYFVAPDDEIDIWKY